MAGIEIVCGKHGEYYAQSWFKQIDKKYLKKIFCVREYDHTVRLRPQTQKNNNKNNIVILDIASCITFYILSYFFDISLGNISDEEDLRGGDTGRPLPPPVRPLLHLQGQLEQQQRRDG